MAIDPRQQQKKLEKQRAKKAAEQRAGAARPGDAGPHRAGGRRPDVHCFRTSTLTEHGIGEVLISRKLSYGNVAFAIFLVNIYCLGVKDVIVNIGPEALYRKNVYEEIGSADNVDPHEAQYRKLVEGAVQYALDMELPPHADYRVARQIFGDINAAACTEGIHLWQERQALFRRRPVQQSQPSASGFIRLMEKHCGPGGSHYLMRVSKEKVRANHHRGDPL